MVIGFSDALAGGLIGAGGVLAGAIVSAVITWKLGGVEREHGAALHRADRLFEMRVETYVAMAKDLEILRGILALTLPAMTWEGMPNPPDVPDEGEWREMRARLVVCGSRDVLTVMDDVWGTARAFMVQAATVQDIERIGGEWSNREERAALEPRREASQEAIDKAQRAMREELAAL